MHVGVLVAVLNVALKTRVGEPELSGNDIATVSLCFEVYLTLYSISLFNGYPRNVTSCVKRMHVGVAMAKPHLVWKTLIGETKILGNDIPPSAICYAKRFERLA